MDRFAIVTGDITASDAEAIVNAANRTLLGAAAWTAPSMPPQARSCWRNAGPFTAARRAEPS